MDLQKKIKKNYNFLKKNKKKNKKNKKNLCISKKKL